MKKITLVDIWQKLDAMEVRAAKTERTLEVIESTKPVTQDEFARLFKYMHTGFDKLERELARKADSDVMLTKLDGILARLDADDTERIMLSRQVDRHKSWVKQLANKTETTLKPQPR